MIKYDHQKYNIYFCGRHTMQKTEREKNLEMDKISIQLQCFTLLLRAEKRAKSRNF